MEYSFDVLAKHIEDGIKGNANKCPVALALRDKGYTRVGVFNTSLHFCTEPTEHEQWFAHPLPTELEEFIKSFDKYGKDSVPPSTFTIWAKERKELLGAK